VAVKTYLYNRDYSMGPDAGRPARQRREPDRFFST